MLRRLLPAVLPLAIAALVVVGASPATAAFAGGATASAPSSATVGASVTVTVDHTGLNPAPSSYTVLWQSQPTGGGAIDTLVTAGPVDTEGDGSTAITFTGQTTANTYLFATVTLTDGSSNYVVSAQTTIVPGTFTAPGTLAVSGTAHIGQTLTATTAASAWSPTPSAVTYTWYDVSGGAVLGTGTTYELTIADLGRTLYVQAAATLAGYTTSEVASTWIGAVGSGGLTLTSAPAITGGLRVGATATATAPDLSPTPDAIAYQWFTSDGTPIAGATSLTFTPTPDLLGRSLYLEATASRAGYQSYVVGSNLSGTVALAALAPVTNLTVPSAATFGVALTLTAPTFSPAADAVSYQWYRTPDVEITGATGTSYTPTSADLGTQLYVVASATRANTQSYEAASNLTGAVALASFTTAPTPTLTGAGLAGAAYTVDAHADSWAPTPTTMTYRWFRASVDNPVGTLLIGVTGTTYTPTDSDIGSYVYVETTAHRAGYADFVIGTAPSRAVGVRWVQTDTADGAVSTTVGGRLTVTLHGLTPLTTYQLELHSTPVALGSFTTDATGSVEVDLALPGSVVAGNHTLIVLLGGTQVLSAPVTVSAPATTAGAASTTGTLAATGAAPGPVLACATGLLLLGAGLHRVGRRGLRRAPAVVARR
ncbi:MAG: hypothetical protein L6311_16910 [Cellulomonas sp.]|nr:hypothetical protein [Cellulomonas sp.]